MSIFNGSQCCQVDNQLELNNVVLTSKDRMKVSTYSTNFFSTFQHNKSTEVWDEQLTSNATVTWDSNLCAISCAVTSEVGSKVIRQTKIVMRYVPGRPGEFSSAFIFGAPVIGIRKRIGMFDESNGFYLEQAIDGAYYCVVRSKTSGLVTETRISQSNWNIDKLDGLGRTGIVLNKEAIQLLIVDYEWYGAGVVTFCLIIRDERVPIHTFYAANIINVPWCSTPFIPIRIEIENLSSSSSDSMIHISQCHSQEASSDNLGKPLSITTNNGGYTMTTGGVYYPVLSIRLKSTALNSVIIPLRARMATLDNTFIFFRLILNATLISPVWTNHPVAESSIQYDLSATGLSGGIVSDQGFSVVGETGELILNERADSANYQLGRSSLGTVSDILTIAMSAINSNKSGVSTINWVEQR